MMCIIGPTCVTLSTTLSGLTRTGGTGSGEGRGSVGGLVGEWGRQHGVR